MCGCAQMAAAIQASAIDVLGPDTPCRVKLKLWRISDHPSAKQPSAPSASQPLPEAARREAADPMPPSDIPQQAASSHQPQAASTQPQAAAPSQLHPSAHHRALHQEPQHRTADQGRPTSRRSAAAAAAAAAVAAGGSHSGSHVSSQGGSLSKGAGLCLDANVLTIPDAVLCSEMGVHFSPCGRYLVACIACAAVCCCTLFSLIMVISFAGWTPGCVCVPDSGTRTVVEYAQVEPVVASSAHVLQLTGRVCNFLSWNSLQGTPSCLFLLQFTGRNKLMGNGHGLVVHLFKREKIVMST